MRKKKKRFFLGIFFALIIFFVIFILFNLINISKRQYEISSFEECYKNGFLIEETNPRKCITKNGTIFLEENVKNIEFEKIKIKIKNNLNFNEPFALIINEKTVFEEFFEGHFDFNTSSIIFVFDGEKPTGGYSIEIEEIKEKKDLIEVKVNRFFPGEDCLLIQMLTYPFDVVKIEKRINKRIRVIYEDNIKSCSKTNV